MQPVQYIQAFITLLSLIVVVKALAMRGVPATRYFLPLSIAVLFYAFGYLLELDSSSLEGAFFGQRVQSIGVCCYAVLFYCFVRDYDNRPVSKWAVCGMLAFPGVALLMVNIWPASTLYFRQVAFSAVPSPHLVITRGILHQLHILYSFFFVALSALDVLLHYAKNTPANRRRRIAFTTATLAPSIAILIFAIDTLPVPMQFGSASLVLSLFILGFYILFYRPQDWLPFARDKVLDGLDDGFLLVDTHWRYLDANKKAMFYFPELRQMTQGQGFAGIPNLQGLLPPKGHGAKEIKVHTQDGTVYLMCSITPIAYNNRPVCCCLLFYDATHQHRMMREMEHLATHDMLTGLLNRTSFFSLAQRDFGLAQRTGNQAAVMMLDIDFFKRVNDEYGHQAGDEVLRKLGEILQNRLRRTDLGGRYGGEEFCLFLPATGTQGAMSIANDIRAEIEGTEFYHENQRFHVTISIGLSEVDLARHKKVDDMIAEADTALYQAKHTGRNKVVPFLRPHINLVATPSSSSQNTSLANPH